jgi:DNA-binding response OmpR family regulator
MYEWVAKNCPGLEKGLLFTFSTVTDQQTRTFLHDQGVPSLAKPFEVADLISHVRALSQREDSHGIKREKTEARSSAASAGA